MIPCEEKCIGNDLVTVSTKNASIWLNIQIVCCTRLSNVIAVYCIKNKKNVL